MPLADHLSRLLELSQGLVAVTERDGRIRSVNTAWEDVLGWTEAQLVGEPIITFVHADDASGATAALAKVAAGEELPTFTNRCRHRDGTFHDLQWSATADETGMVYLVARDVTDLRGALTTAQRHEDLWRSVLRTAADPIVVIDRDGTILRANEATAQLFGYGHGELVGEPVSCLMPEPERSEHDGYIARYLETGEAKIIGVGREVTAERADGTTFPIALAVSEVTDAGGSQFMGIMHDLSAQRAAADQLQQANDLLEARVKERTIELETSMAELARSNRDLEQFAYIASHDLQAPLRNVRQGLELLNDHLDDTFAAGFDDEARELRRLIVGAVDRMDELIHGLLTYSRVQRQAQPTSAVVDLDEVADDVIGQMRIDLESAGAMVDADALPTVAGDPLQLRQLLQNLIQNAVKYRLPDRTPEISISSSFTDDRWLISVADNGVGVDPKQHDRIFDLFRRGHPGYEGVGLGLAICQRIVEQHGGEIWVTSEPNEGATFSFTLPRRADRDSFGG